MCFDPLYCADARHLATFIPPNSIHLVVTSPPYNGGVRYATYDDARPDAEHLLDPFAGSGTVGVACQRLGCRATLVEVDPVYCELAAQRLALPGSKNLSGFQNLTGLDREDKAVSSANE